ncbi:hypothetical protein [Nocardia wallacei]|uniref:hypothetical protein n=1 Tax=Nocardia wallacei TaxID=480035 RepID=UPI002453F724|nr:hypothetical protein [Nocardia wallacei]
MTDHDRPEVTVTAALTAANLPASGVELAELIARYPALRAAIDALYALPGIQEATPMRPR